MNNLWKDICLDAEGIPNVADRVFVMALIAPEIARYYRDDRSFPRNLLEKAEALVPTIPTLIDRADRLETIGDSWQLIGEKTKAQFAVESAFKLVSQLEGATADAKLNVLIQAAYKCDRALADDLVSRLDSRTSTRIVSPSALTLEVEKLRSNPSQLDRLESLRYARGAVLGVTAQRLLGDFATGRAIVPGTNILEEWLLQSRTCQPGAVIDVAHYVVESLWHMSHRAAPQSRADVFLKAAQLTYDLAKWLSNARGEGIPEAIYDSFPGLSAKVVSFRVGEGERAKNWLAEWLSKNARGYLKICDPYFGLEQLEYLMYVPVDCRVLVVTTDKCFALDKGMREIQSEIERYWGTLSAQVPPSVQLLIVSHEHEDRFHDRAIITAAAGLDLGASLNTLGKSRCKITVLSEEDARELERTYIAEMLNNATWFMEGVRPTVLFLGA